MHQRKATTNSGNSVGTSNSRSGHFGRGTSGSNNNNNGTNGSKAGSMYSRSGSGSYNRGDVEGGGRYNDTNANILEQQNNDRISELGDQVARLKGLTIDIGNEVREQNSLLDSMGEGFMNTRDMLAGSLQRIGTMLETTGGKHMCYMVTFAVLAIIFLYWVMTFKGKTGA